MKVGVTGSQGQLGQALLALKPAGCSVLGWGRAELDLTDAVAIRRLLDREQPDVVVNTAAYTAVDQAEAEPGQAEAVNALAPAELAAGCRAINARLIHLSTDFVFDGRAGSPYVPDAPTNPLSVYGRSKRDGEQAALLASEGQATVLRTAWVYGPGGRNFVATMRRLIGERDTVRVVADQRGSPTSTHSLARAIYDLIETGAGVGQTLHWTDAGDCSWYEFACAIRECMRGEPAPAQCAEIESISTAEFPTAATRPAYSVLDCSGWPGQQKARHWREELGRIWPLLNA